MQSLERRIADLEKSSHTGDALLNIVVHFVTPGDLEKEIQALHCRQSNQRWERQPGETEGDLINRAGREVTRSGLGCVALLLTGEAGRH